MARVTARQCGNIVFRLCMHLQAFLESRDRSLDRDIIVAVAPPHVQAPNLVVYWCQRIIGTIVIRSQDTG